MLDREEMEDLDEKIGVEVDEGTDSTDLVHWDEVSDVFAPVASRSSRISTSHLHLN